jgi:hypothetical protein
LEGKAMLKRSSLSDQWRNQGRMSAVAGDRMPGYALRL